MDSILDSTFLDDVSCNGDFLPLLASGWDVLGNHLYRAHELYKIEWNIPLPTSKQNDFIPAPYSGLIAVIAQNVGQTYVTVYILSSSGNLHNKFLIKMLSKNDIICASWSHMERFEIITSDCRWFTCELNGRYSVFTIPEIKEIKKFNCCVFGEGIVILLDNKKILLINEFKVPSYYSYLESCDIEFTNDPPRVWAPRATSLNHAPKAPFIVISQNKSVRIINLEDGETNQICVDKPAILSFSPNKEFMAIVTEDGKLFFASLSSKKNFHEYNISEGMPLIMDWCGSDAVLLIFDNKGILVGTQNAREYIFDKVLCICSEIDGIRVLTASKCHFIEIVPESHIKTFGIGSVEPSAVFYNTYKSFRTDSMEFEYDLLSNKEYLINSIDNCIYAALNEFSKKVQIDLLKAVWFTLPFADRKKRRSISFACKILRVLNYLRSKDLGIPLSFVQYNAFTAQNLVYRLSNLCKYDLSLKICNFLGMDSKQILTNWACTNILISIKEAEINEFVEKKLKKSTYKLEYDKIALTALESGHINAAISIIKADTITNQAKIFLKIGMYELAIEMAEKTCNADLIFMILRETQKNVDTIKLFKLIRNCQMTKRIYAKHFENKYHVLRDLYSYEDEYHEIGRLHVYRYKNEKEVAQKENALKRALFAYNKSQSHSFEFECIEQEIRLINQHKEILDTYSQNMFNMTVTDTLCMLLVSNLVEAALKMKERFNISDRRFTFLKVKSFIISRNWRDLEDIIKKTRDHLLFEFTIEMLFDADESAQAKRVIEIINSN